MHISIAADYILARFLLAANQRLQAINPPTMVWRKKQSIGASQ
jgi:hypothetical protein